MTTLWTLGHSTRLLDEFVGILAAHRIETLVDVRRFPTSRRNPHYSADPLRRSLFQAGIRYAYEGHDLGGMRTAKASSRHSCLKGSGFQSYADWMETPTFRRGAEKVARAGAANRTALMCAERAPPACHRSLLADYLVLVHGLDVVDILDADHAGPHVVTRGARRADDGVVYDRAGAAAPLERFGASP